MTVTTLSAGPTDREPDDPVTVTIDGSRSRCPKGTLLIRAAEQLGIQIPRFCDHPLLDPVGACRQCLVEVEGQRKPLASCTTTVTTGMVVKTQLTSPVADKAQQGVMELLLINHPLDCPICDKGGECPLQNQAHEQRPRREPLPRATSAPSPSRSPISTEVLLDRERCVLLPALHPLLRADRRRPVHRPARARRRSSRSASPRPKPFQSYFSGNTIQICPVGALTGAAYRFRARPFDLVSTPTRLRALRVRLRAAHRPPARQGDAPAGRRRPAGQRGVELRQGPLGLPLRRRSPTG